MAIETKIEGHKLIITCDLEEPTRSASVETLVVTSTRGNMKTSLKIGGTINNWIECVYPEMVICQPKAS